MDSRLCGVVSVTLALTFTLPAFAVASPQQQTSQVSSRYHLQQVAPPPIGPREFLTGLLARKTAAADRKTVAAAAATHFHWPYGVAVDQAGNVFVANEANSTVVEFNSALSGSSTFSTKANAMWPISIAVDSADDIYVGSENGVVVKYASNGSPICA